MRYILVTIFVLVVNAVAVAATYLLISHQITSKSRLILQSEREMNRFSNFGHQVNSSFLNSETRKAKEQLIEELKIKQGSLSQILAAVGTSIPKEVWLMEWTQTEQNATLNGYAMSNDHLATFISTLAKNPLFLNIALASTQPKKIDGVNVYQFQLVCIMGGGIND